MRSHISDVTAVNEKKETQAKDEIEYATNWNRAFNQIFREIKWLNAYAISNEIASNKILNKFMKTQFVQKDNIVDKCLVQYL